MTKLDEVGRAILVALNQGGITMADVARAAVTALREPSEAMVWAGEDVDLQTDFDEPGRAVGWAATQVWISMVDALLAEAAPTDGSEG